MAEVTVALANPAVDALGSSVLAGGGFRALQSTSLLLTNITATGKPEWPATRPSGRPVARSALGCAPRSARTDMNSWSPAATSCLQSPTSSSRL